jgi:hypothetical protein
MKLLVGSWTKKLKFHACQSNVMDSETRWHQRYWTRGYTEFAERRSISSSVRAICIRAKKTTDETETCILERKGTFGEKLL